MERFDDNVASDTMGAGIQGGYLENLTDKCLRIASERYGSSNYTTYRIKCLLSVMKNRISFDGDLVSISCNN